MKRVKQKKQLGKTDYVFNFAGTCTGIVVNTGKDIVKFPFGICGKGITAVARVVKRNDFSRDDQTVEEKNRELELKVAEENIHTHEKDKIKSPVKVATKIKAVKKYPGEKKAEVVEKLETLPKSELPREPRPVKKYQPRPVKKYKTETAEKPVEVEKDVQQQVQAPLDTHPLSSFINSAEVEAAVFESATEKVVFTRALSELLSDDIEMRREAVLSLGRIQHELTSRVIIAHLADERTGKIRKECIKVLAELEARAGVPAIKKALDDSVVSVRLAALRALYRLAGPESASVFVKMFRDENKDVRRRAASCVSWLSYEPPEADLGLLLDDKSAVVRRAALEIMENIQSLKYVPKLIELLADPDKSVRKKAFYVIQIITGKELEIKFPTDEEGLQRLIARWEAWWEEESSSV